MEDGLVLPYKTFKTFLIISLNPCCNGRWSRTNEAIIFENEKTPVLILVVMEDGLVHVMK